jgi:hypothetical protein
MDATVIDLCLSVFPWTAFRQRKGAIKLQYIYDHRGSLTAFMVMTEGKRHDVRVAKARRNLIFTCCRTASADQKQAGNTRRKNRTDHREIESKISKTASIGLLY